MHLTLHAVPDVTLFSSMYITTDCPYDSQITILLSFVRGFDISRYHAHNTTHDQLFELPVSRACGPRTCILSSIKMPWGSVVMQVAASTMMRSRHWTHTFGRRSLPELTHVANTSAAFAAGLYAFAVQMTICHPLVTRGAAQCRRNPGQTPGGFTRLALGRRGAALPFVRGRAAPTVPARQ